MNIIKPILFNTEMVRATLDGRKTATRRVVKPQFCTFADGKTEEFVRIESDKSFRFLGVAKDHENIKTVLVPPCTEGDILYVRETWVTTEDGNVYLYRADANPAAGGFIRDKAGKLHAPRWRPSIHMPKEAARIFLRVTDVRVERLQEITDEGAEHEGICGYYVGMGESAYSRYSNWNEAKNHLYDFPRGAFADLWTHTLKPTDIGKYGWTANPWVWVIEFERISREEAQERMAAPTEEGGA